MARMKKVNPILPNVLVLKSKANSKYLRYVNDDDAKNKGFVAFTGGEARIPDAKFHLEPATASDENQGLVHIRSCFNNKYLCRLDPDSSWIVATAKEPAEEKFHSECTLFKPELVGRVDDDNVEVRLLHVQLQVYVMLFSKEPDYDACMMANSRTPDPNSADVFIVTNWESLMILPKYVALKSAACGKYLFPSPETGLPQFSCDDIGVASVALEIIPDNTDGTIVCIKNRSTGENLLAYDDSDVPGLTITYFEDKDDKEHQRFEVVMVDSKTIALRCLYNKKFCRYDKNTYNNNSDLSLLFTAIEPSMTKETFLLVEEPVLKRTVSVDFRFDDARIYGVTPLTVLSQTATNKTDTEDPVSVNISFSHKFSKTTTWNNSGSIKGGVKTTFETEVPFVVKGEIEVSVELSYTHDWGGAVTTEDTVDYQVQVQVPKGKKVEVSLLARQGTCDIPFSYIQTDTLASGKKVSTDFHDGVYTGVGYFDFNSVTETLDD